MKQLAGHALALELAGDYIQANQISFEVYVSTRQQSSWTTVLQRGSMAYGHRSLAGAWDISYQHIRQQSNHAAEMLVCCGFMDSSRIPLALFKASREGKSGMPLFPGLKMCL